MPRNQPLTPKIADAVLLGLAMLSDADSAVPQLEAPEAEAVIGLLAVAQLVLADIMADTGDGAGTALSEVRATALTMADDSFSEAAETMWAAGLLEAFREWPDLYAGQAMNALRHAAGGIGGVATILLLMASKSRGITEEALVAEYRAQAIADLAAV